jgi:6-phosphogluconolactonase
MVFEGSLIVSPSKEEVPSYLNPAILLLCVEAIDERDCFTVALSGGSLPGFLSKMKESAAKLNIEPRFEKWHVILADERCVPLSDPDSNLGALKQELFSSISIPESQIFGISEEKLKESTSSVAAAYESVVKSVMEKSGGQLDLAVLGFGPDGHTCSLFPGHPLLEERNLWVAPIEDSPKPPPNRITLTFAVLNTKTRHIIFCGSGASKAPILQEIFASVKKLEDDVFKVTMKEPFPYPCAGVLPNSNGVENSLTYVVDKEAIDGVFISE